MSDILNEKVDLSALNLGSFTLSALLGAVVTFCICVIAMRLILSLLRRMLDKTRLDATLRKYALGAVRLVLWVIIVLIVADQLAFPSRRWWHCCQWFRWPCRSRCSRCSATSRAGSSSS